MINIDKIIITPSHCRRSSQTEGKKLQDSQNLNRNAAILAGIINVNHAKV